MCFNEVHYVYECMKLNSSLKYPNYFGLFPCFVYQISLPVVPLLQFKCMLYIKGRTMKESVFAIMHDVLKIAKLTKVGLQSVHL